MNDKYMEKFVRGMLIAMAVKGYSKADMARLSGVNQAFFTRVKTTSSSSNPRLSTLIKIAGVFDMNIENVIDLPERAEQLLIK